MPDVKPPFNPNEPYKAPESQSNSKPAFNPQADFKAAKPEYVPHIDDFMPVPNDNTDKIESAINFLDKNPTTKGGLIDVDKDILRDVMKHPNVTQNQIKEAIGTMQSGNLYYLKNENGVMVPKQLKNGERPPKGYNVQSVWGTQNDANDDSWYTDLGKSLYNGVIGAVEGVADLGQLATMGITNKPSSVLDKTTNALNALKFEKDEDLNKSIYNTEGIKEWGDLVSKDRFDFSGNALWGTVNSIAESAASFLTGAAAAGKVAKGVQGVKKLSELTNGAKKAAAFTGSFLQQVGDNLDASREAGLEGREASAIALVKTTLQAGIDASLGIDALIFKNLIGKSEKEIFKNIVGSVEKDATGMITEDGFKQLAKEYAWSYAEIAKSGIKEYGKTILKEGVQEASQDFVGKSAEQLWDKLSGEDKAKFGTEANSAESFGSYAQNFFAGLVGGAAFGVLNTNAKKKYDEQSASAFKTVQKGPEAVKELKNNLLVAKEKGNISIPQYEQAIFKIDAYDKYNEQTKDIELDDKQKKEAFELSFNIEALKHEISGISSEDMEKLDPIGHAKINNKKTLINDLQKELDAMLIKSDIQTETKVGQDTVDKVAKAEEPKEDQATLKSLIKKFGPPAPPKTEPIKTDIGVVNKRRASNPKFDEVDAAGNHKFNTLRPLEKKEVLHDYFDEHPELNNEIEGKIVQAQNNVWKVDLGNGKFVQLAKSIVPEQFVGDTSKLEGQTIEKKDSSGQSYIEYKEPVVMKLENIEGKGEREGQRLRILNVYTKNSGKYIMSVKEKEKGNTEYHPKEIEQMQALQQRGYIAPNIEVKSKKEPKLKELNPIDKETEERDLAQNRELSSEEVLSELEKEFAREETFSETGQFQKQANQKGDITKIVERIKKSFPKVKVVLDNNIKGAGQVKGNILSINPDYTGLDTPIHEAGHILIDAIGYNNKVIQSAIKQLMNTELWAKTKELYPELNEEMLGKEVLAEAIGREGTNIFDKEVDKSKFKAFLDYIFNKLKQLFGIDKNIAKSLSKQVISGIGTKELEGNNEVLQESRRKGISEEEKNIKNLVKAISEESDLNKYSNEDLIEVYNSVFNTKLSKEKKKEYLSDVMKRIALNIKQRGINTIGKEVDEDNLQKDISFIDKWFKVLSHFSDSFPEMKEFSKIWNNAYFAKMKESKAEKRTHDKLALAVINERNKKLGITETVGRYVGQIISENRHNYFGFLDNGKGKLITLEDANKKGLSKEQKDYIKYTREMLAARQKIDTDIYEADMDVLRMDKSFAEAYKTEGIISAVGSWLGSSALSNIQLNFTDPNTGKISKMDFIDIQNNLSKYAEKGLKEKAQALVSLIKYTLKASKKRVKKSGEYLLDENGNLQSKFNKPIDARKGYSKDFYGALNQYIDDSSHIKHISPLVPIINSIEYLNSKDIFDADGNLIGEQKKNLTEWIDKWRKLHVLGQQEETKPELDKALRLLRFMTSAVTMWFNVPANILNVAIGNYNTIRDQDAVTWLIGQKRLFGGADRKFGVLNKYAYDLANKYIVVSNDTDSNPIQSGRGLFAKLAYLGQSWGEFQIQSSALFGLMNKEDFNSFEYKINKHGVEELVVKEGIDEKALEERILANIDKVSDVQGKYGEKDKRNVMNNEIGKAALAYRVWIPDAWRVRYGSNGSWVKMLNGGFSEMRKQIKDKGFVESLIKGKDTEEVKDFKRNLKGIMATGLLISLVYSTDDDDEKTFASKLFQKALSDVLFVFEPDNLKFTIKSPAAVIGTVEKLINLGDHLFAIEANDFYNKDSKYGDEGDSKVRGDIIGLLPGKKIIDQVVE